MYLAKEETAGPLTPDTPAAMFNRIVQDASALTNTSSNPTRRFRLRLRPVERIQFPNLDRRWKLVAPELLDVLRRLATGELDWPLLLFGGAGRGKTLASLCLCDIALSSVYHDAETLANWTMNRPPTEMAEVWSEIARKELVVLDEIGTRSKVTDLPYRMVMDLAETREKAGRVATIYITNINPTDLAALYDDRIASRLMAGTHFELKGKDRRKTP
jgi:hypothetical protein